MDIQGAEVVQREKNRQVSRVSAGEERENLMEEERAEAKNVSRRRLEKYNL